MTKGSAMITLHRSASFLPGKLTNAVAFAKEVAAHAKTVTGAEVSVAMPIGGNPMRIGWAARYENLGAYEAAMGKLMADAKYLEMVGKAGEIFMAGSTHDEIWRTI
jgi:ketopantoate hydroxymethyltransferase